MSVKKWDASDRSKGENVEKKMNEGRREGDKWGRG